MSYPLHSHISVTCNLDGSNPVVSVQTPAADANWHRGQREAARAAGLRRYGETVITRMLPETERQILRRIAAFD